ncbi:hypothetical protein SCA6_007398 [Theobroma cacao]
MAWLVSEQRRQSQKDVIFNCTCGSRAGYSVVVLEARTAAVASELERGVIDEDDGEIRGEYRL